MKTYAVAEIKDGQLNTPSHIGNTYVTSPAQDIDEMLDDKHVLRQIRGFKENCDNEAADAGKKVKYYHITVMAVFGDEVEK